MGVRFWTWSEGGRGRGERDRKGLDVAGLDVGTWGRGGGQSSTSPVFLRRRFLLPSFWTTISTRLATFLAVE